MVRQVIAAVVVLLLMAFAAYAALFFAPTERSMGVIQRIFYLHVPSAWTAFTAFFICFIANLQYVFRRQPRWDWLAVASAEVGLAFTTVVLVTGPIWAKPVWGIWWTWDARLTSTFVLWLLYVSYLLLRTLIEEPDRRALLSALFGIFAFIDVPLVFGSRATYRRAGFGGLEGRALTAGDKLQLGAPAEQIGQQGHDREQRRTHQRQGGILWRAECPLQQSGVGV